MVPSTAGDVAWTALGAMLIGALVRLVKDDVSWFPVNVPARWRPILAIALGGLQAALQSAATGATWQVAVRNGIAAALVAIAAHDAIIEGARGGKEFFAPNSAQLPSLYDKTDPDASLTPKETPAAKGRSIPPE